VLIIRRSNSIIQHLVSSHSVGGRPVRSCAPSREAEDEVLRCKSNKGKYDSLLCGENVKLWHPRRVSKICNKRIKSINAQL